MSIISDAGGRKFILAIVLMTIFTVFVVTDKMTVDQFMTAVLINLGIFSSANVAQKFVPKSNE